jgi:3-oxoacyl-[acyl-carrier protein] reductase
MTERRDPGPLAGRSALVTGVSRRAGIGYATARRLLGYGAHVVVHHHVPHDAGQPWGADPGGIEAVLDGLRAAGPLAGDLAADLVEPDAPTQVVDAAVRLLGHLDVLVCNHARSNPDGALGALDAGILDGHWAVDARSTILLAQEFAARHDGRPGGRIVLLTSGQGLGPMPGEVAYAAAKGALAAITATLADQLADAGITLNTVNPGPVDTGYLSPEAHSAAAPGFPGGRWAEPDDPARLIAWLVTDEARSITGQVINSESGFRRWGPGPD